MLEMLYAFLPSIGAGIIQSTTGFGAGIFIMLFFPLFLPMLQSSAVSTLITLVLTASLAWKYRKHADVKTAVRPAIFYFLFSFLAVWFAKGADMTGLKAVFGLFLIAMSIYFLLFADRLKVKAGWLSAFVCGGISGAASGLFGIGGPPMVVYMLAITGDDKEAYLGNIQFFFLLSGIYTTALRVASGIITPKLLLLVLPGIAGILIGKYFGQKILDRINVAMMKKLIYIFLGLSGLLTFVTNI